MTDGSYLMRHRSADLQLMLKKAGVSFTGGESVYQLELMAAAAGLATQPLVGLYLANGSGSTDQSAPSGTGGYLGALDTSKGLVVSTRQTVDMAAGRRAILHGVVTLGTTAGGIVDAIGIPVVSTNGGTVWSAMTARRFGTYVSSDRPSQLSVVGLYEATTAVTAIFGVCIGNVDNTSVITCLGEHRTMLVQTF